MAALVIAHLIVVLLAVVAGFAWTRTITSEGAPSRAVARRHARRARGALAPDPARATS